MFYSTRRSALIGLRIGLALPFLTRAAMAQTTPVETPIEQSDYIGQTLMAGSVSLRTSQIALERANNPLVKEFARLEVAEQMTIATVLSSTQAGTIPPAVPPEQATIVQTLSNLEAGPALDIAYTDGQIDGHTMLLNIQKTLSGSSEATIEVVTAKLVEQSITSHLAMLNYIREQLDNTTAA